jgi:hypothetical protein
MNVNLDESIGIPSTYNFINDYGVNPSMIIIFSVILIIYYFLFSSLGTSAVAPVQTVKSPSLVVLEVLLWGTFIALFLLNGVKYFYDIDMIASINKIFSPEPEIDITIDKPTGPTGPAPLPEIKFEKQVFHIPNNKYTYGNAQALCAAYGSRLASYDEIEKAYKGGGEWCGFGWSKDQMALYPTQKKTYNKLQKIKGHEHDCGRPGINGGFIDNKNVRFGVNCYGYKPVINDREKEMMEDTPLYPKTKEDIKQQQLIEYWKQKLPEILVAPFNKKKWSKV